MKNLKYLILLIVFASCDMHLEVSKPEDIIIIPEGRHSSVRSFKGFEGESLKFDARFDKTAIYTTQNPLNQADINKLMGFSSCSSHHHENSARIGWRWYDGKLEIFGYTYFEGQRAEKFITDVALDTFVSYEITRLSDGYVFRVGEAEVKIETGTSCVENSNYMLWPYFGGDETAPHEIKIQILDIQEIPSETNTNYKNG